MKKNVYTIGRDESCDIVICDDSNIASRFHANLKEEKPGKYVITDQSTNGTYINGIRITQGVEVPVTREDSIRFANIVELDWSMIPDTRKKNNRVILITILCSLLCVGLGWCAYYFYFAKEKIKDEEGTKVTVTVTDSVKTQKADTVKVKPVAPKPVHKKPAQEPKPVQTQPKDENPSKVVNPIF